MKITRSSKTPIRFATKKKRDILNEITDEYSRVANIFIVMFFGNSFQKKDLKKEITNIPEQCCAREALGMVRGAVRIEKGRNSFDLWLVILKILLFLAMLYVIPCFAQADGSYTDINIILKSYQGYIKGSEMKNDLTYLLLSNGEKLVYDDKMPKSFEEKLDNPDLEDTLSLVYPLKNPIDKMNLNDDPGRFRSLALLKAVYGKNKKDVRTNLIRVNFCGKKVLFNKQNGAADALKNAGTELLALTKVQPQLKKYIKPLGGTFKWRNIAGTSRLSPHSFGIAIDMNPKRSAYWRGHSETKMSEFSRLNYPAEIVAIFEKNGFIWGGKWYHFDTMHFEFRPEIIAKAR